jgi:hypothetical protein
MAEIDYFATTDTVHLATELRTGGEVVTPIWAVVVDGVPYIRSGYGPESKWYRRLQRTGRAAFVDGSHRYPVTIENVTTGDNENPAAAATNAQVDAAYRAKYAGQGSALASMIAGSARAYTMRLRLASGGA